MPSLAKNTRFGSGFATSRVTVLLALALTLVACQSVPFEQQAAETDESVEILVSPSSTTVDGLDGTVVSGTIEISVPAEGWMHTVHFFLNGERIGTSTSAPFEMALDTTLLPNGPHTVGVEARMRNNRVRVSQTIAVSVNNDVGDAEEDPSPKAPDVEEPSPVAPGDGDRAVMSLRGDPAFDANDLSPEQRSTYEAIKRLIATPPTGQFNPYVMADKDCIWWYGHGLQTHVQAVLIAFRVTGDLSLLDHVDELGELMRARLHDSWRGTADGTDGTSDGFLNWVMRANTSSQSWNAGKDTNIQYDMKAHATAAMIAYALHANRDLVSPSGYDYAGHADAWADYLVNHFEAKMRSREKKPTGFPIKEWPPQVSSYSDWAKWHYYMGEITGGAGYTAEASRMSDVMLGQLRTVGTPQGSAYVWMRSNPDMPGGTATYLSPTTYAEFVLSNAVEFHLEGFHFWADPVHMERFARTITQLVMDEPDPIRNGLAADVGGEQEREGIPSKSGFRRITPAIFATTNLALLTAWDTTTALPSLAADMHDYNASLGVDTSRILAGLMLNTHLHSDPSAMIWAGR